MTREEAVAHGDAGLALFWHDALGRLERGEERFAVGRGAWRIEFDAAKASTNNKENK